MRAPISNSAPENWRALFMLVTMRPLSIQNMWDSEIQKYPLLIVPCEEIRVATRNG
ncbi:hypothetical protein SAMN05443244_1873 [Terriglobus roseus]|uniref:Uncharacterized protein n=1 Tax=Terriglobus roseus TaxID=392734 RepID=A0A1H4MCC6_9BACT|nr:hypothetical protein SAMN05443244_1873 [Terriglobus roseus]